MGKCTTKCGRDSHEALHEAPHLAHHLAHHLALVHGLALVRSPRRVQMSCSSQCLMAPFILQAGLYSSTPLAAALQPSPSALLTHPVRVGHVPACPARVLFHDNSDPRKTFDESNLYGGSQLNSVK